MKFTTSKCTHKKVETGKGGELKRVLQQSEESKTYNGDSVTSGFFQLQMSLQLNSNNYIEHNLVKSNHSNNCLTVLVDYCLL